VLIERGDQIVTIPNRDTILFPYDKIYVIGTDEQTNLLFSKIENKASKDDKKTNFNSFEMNNIVINDSSSLCGNTIHDSGLKEKINGIIIGIEKNGNQVLNPDSSVKLEAGDVVLIFGDKELIKEIKEKS
jgi:monovalent cation:H+ antiporter-2, CPA2 family